MKEFIEKLIDRLEERVNVYPSGYGCMSYGVRAVQISEATEIVNQLAEEYKDIDCSKCSRRSWYQKGYADAKKKLAEEYNNDVCEWKEDEKFNWFFKSPHEGVGIVKEESGLFNFCPCCGKKIKVVEQYGKG